MEKTTRRHALLLALAAGVLLAQQTAAKTARDALFLTSEGSAALPRAMVASAVLSLVVVLVMAKLISRLGPWLVLTITLVLNGGLFVMEGALAGTAAWIPIALYLHIAALGSMLVSAFWSVVTERFDPFTARQVMGRIGAGATLGGAVGGAMADGLNRLLGSRGLLFTLAGMSVIAALLLANVRVRERATNPSLPATTDSPFAAFREAPYLVALAGLSLLGALWAGLIDFGMKTEIDAAFDTPDQLVSFFGWFYTSVGILTFLVQSLLGGRLLKRYGIDVVVAILPVVVGSVGLVTGALASTWLIVGLRGLETMLANSVHRSSYELFFTPLPNAIKRSTKTIVDVAATRLGDAIAGGLMVALLAAVPNASARVPVFVGAIAAILAFGLIATLHRGYVQALTQALRTGPMDLGPQEDLDALTQRTLAGTGTGVDREALLREIEEFRKEQAGPQSRGAVPRMPHTTLSTTSIEARIATTLDPRVSLALLFVSSDDARIKRNLERGINSFTVPFVIPLLKRSAVADAAEKALLDLGPGIVGTLSDVLFDASQPRRVRARVASMLGKLPVRRSRDALVLALDEQEASLRLAAARALSVLAKQDAALALSSSAVLELVAKTLSIEAAWDGIASLPPRTEEAAEDALVRLHPRLHVPMTLLALVLDREALEMSIRALGSTDVALRGTAFEYLENVVDEPARTPLLKQLTKAPNQKRRTQNELLDELRRSKA